MYTAKLEELLKEIREVNERLKRIEMILEERLIGIDEPLPDELEEIKKYEEEKKSGKLELIPLEEIVEK